MANKYEGKREMRLQMTADDYNVLVGLANNPKGGAGMRLETYVLEMLRQHIETIDTDTLTIEARVYRLENQARRETSIRESLRNTLWMNLRNGNIDSNSKEFDTVCEKLGLSRDDIMAEISTIPTTVSAASTKADQTATHWLADKLKDGQEYASKDLAALAKQDGISDHYLKSAKDSLGVKSVRREKLWVWVWNKENA